MRRAQRRGSAFEDARPFAPRRERKTLGQRITDALDPDKAPGKVTTLSEMSPERRAEMHRLYGPISAHVVPSVVPTEPGAQSVARSPEEKSDDQQPAPAAFTGHTTEVQR